VTRPIQDKKVRQALRATGGGKAEGGGNPEGEMGKTLRKKGKRGLVRKEAKTSEGGALAPLLERTVSLRR